MTTPPEPSGFPPPGGELAGWGARAGAAKTHVVRA
jgi:hypothetical protein